MQVIYVEKAIENHPRAKRIIGRFAGRAKVISCEHYREVFNPKSQNFRLQKQQPALILAQKTGARVLPTPEGFGIGGEQNYYFSHMLNCLYDCRYCFLQGMYQSANYVLFVNYEDFMQEIAELSCSNPGAYFFSGYDADSLAYEPVSGFLQEFLPFFAEHRKVYLELRTKSANINALLQHESLENVIAAFSFTPHEISQQVEHKVPPVTKRIGSLNKLADRGWRVGLRFDPLIYASNFDSIYAKLIDDIFANLDAKAIHSVSVGPLRFPNKMYRKLVALYPEDKLLAHPLVARKKNVTYPEKVEDQMKHFVLSYLQKYLDKTLVFECQA